MLADLVSIFVSFDDFCKQFEEEISDKQIGDKSESALSISEIGTILIAFHLSDYRHFKHFYLEHVSKYFINDFPCLVSYNRFVELIPNSLIYLICFLNRHCKGECTGISFIDSTSLKVCHNKRIPSNKVFQGLATRGKTSVDWFFGFKLHLIINDQGEILSCQFTPGNVDDRVPVKNMAKKLTGYLVNDFLENICQIEHSRHRSPVNAFANMVSALIAYSFLPKKPSLNLSDFPSIASF